VRYSSNGNYKFPSVSRNSFRNPYTDAVQFFASIYAKELKIAGGDPTWNQENVDGSVIKNLFTLNRNIHQLTLGSLVAITEPEWNELQIGISQAFNVVYPFNTSYSQLVGSIGATISNPGGPGLVAGTYLNVAANNITGTGVGATFDVIVTNPIGITSITNVNPGTGYQVGDTFNFFGIIPGSLSEIITINSITGTGGVTPVQLNAYNAVMGVLDNGPTTPANLLGADASVLGSFAQGVAFADAWNNLKVPYDASIGVETPFLAPILRPAGTFNFYYRYTGLRRWFGFVGYDSLP